MIKVQGQEKSTKRMDSVGLVQIDERLKDDKVVRLIK